MRRGELASKLQSAQLSSDEERKGQPAPAHMDLDAAVAIHPFLALGTGSAFANDQYTPENLTLAPREALELFDAVSTEPTLPAEMRSKLKALDPDRYFGNKYINRHDARVYAQLLVQEVERAGANHSCTAAAVCLAVADVASVADSPQAGAAGQHCPNTSTPRPFTPALCVVQVAQSLCQPVLDRAEVFNAAEACSRP